MKTKISVIDSKTGKTILTRDCYSTNNVDFIVSLAAAFGAYVVLTPVTEEKDSH